MRTIFIVIFLFIPLLAYAEPTATEKDLLDQPVSMLDFGLFRFENKLQNKFPQSEIEVSYIRNSNKIFVTLVYSATDELLKNKTPKQI